MMILCFMLAICGFFLKSVHLSRCLHARSRDVWPLQALGDGAGHGWQGQRLLLDWNCVGGGDWERMGLTRSCETSGESAWTISYPDFTGKMKSRTLDALAA